jgi:hypothetical protein
VSSNPSTTKKKIFLKKVRPNMVVHICNPSTLEADAGLHLEILFPKRRKEGGRREEGRMGGWEGRKMGRKGGVKRKKRRRSEE